MKVKEIFKGIRATNDLRGALKHRDYAYVEMYVNDCQCGRKMQSLYELKHYVESEYVDEFVEKLLNAEFNHTYNNTLSAMFTCRGVVEKVDLFVDMGGF